MPRKRPEFFAENELHCLRQAVDMFGGAKLVSAELWPMKDPIKGGKWLDCCLHQGRPEKLGVREMVAILKLCADSGIHEPKRWFDARMGYEPSCPIDQPSDPMDHVEDLGRLLKRYEALLREAEQITKVMELGIPTKPPLKVA